MTAARVRYACRQTVCMAGYVLLCVEAVSTVLDRPSSWASWLIGAGLISVSDVLLAHSRDLAIARWEALRPVQQVNITVRSLDGAMLHVGRARMARPKARHRG